MKLPDDVLEFLLLRLPGAKVYREGVVACCAYHDEATPSMFVYFDYKHTSSWWFKCQGCGKNGPLYNLVKRLKGLHLNLPAPAAIKRQMVKETIEVYQLDSTRSLPDHYSYFRSRGITDDVSRKFGFKMDYYTPGAIMPVYFERRYQGFIRRNFNPEERRYHISPGLDVGRAMWGYDAVPKEHTGLIYITEGIIDAACLWAVGHPAVALLGKNWDRKLGLLHSLARRGQLACFSDNDRTGLGNFKKLAQRLGARLHFPPLRFKDVSEWATLERRDFLQKIKRPGSLAGS